MDWQAGEEFGSFGCPPYGFSSTVDTTGRIHQPHGHQHTMPWSMTEANSNTSATGGNVSTEIPLLNDDHEKAILSDLCDQTVGGSTPLSTFSYISEYICSNNIDIWPGEVAMIGGTADTTASLDARTGDQRSPTSSSCAHQQLFVRCKRVLESIIARNEQILELLRHKQQQQAAQKRR